MHHSVTHPALYHQGKASKLYSWKIWTEGDEIVTEHGLVDGKKQEARKKATPKNAGRANETTAEEQAVKEALAMWVFKKERKYSETPEGAQQTLFLPMLAKDFFKRQAKVTYPCDIQPKLDGVRALARWEGDKVVLTSRGGKTYDVAHISEALEKVLPKSWVLDGEIYAHGETFQQITRWVKKHRPGESEKLCYWAYDVPMDDQLEAMAWVDRKGALELLKRRLVTAALDSDMSGVQTIVTQTCMDFESVVAVNEVYLAGGFEGSIVRLYGDYPYIFGYRSDGLLKVKEFMDAEFEVTGWAFGKGKMAEAPAWVCKVGEVTFRCLAAGTLEEKRAQGQNAASFVGRMLKVKFFERTEDGIPRFPIALGFRAPEDID